MVRLNPRSLREEPCHLLKRLGPLSGGLPSLSGPACSRTWGTWALSISAGSLPGVIVEDIVSEPPKMLAIHTVDMLPFIEVGDRESIPKVNGLLEIRGNVSNRLSFIVVKDLFHRDRAFRERCFSGQTATRKSLNFYQFIRNGPVRQPQSRLNGLRGLEETFTRVPFAPLIYRANSTALVSRMTVTLICPG
jgi:hypothetical protein